VALSFALTAIIQSSGATIGMAFALTRAGVFDSLWQTYPIVIGAQIGTCATPCSAPSAPASIRAAPPSATCSPTSTTP
jgi:Na+/phosphate symporter